MGRSKPLLPLGETDFLGTLLRALRDPAVAVAPVAVVYRRDDAALAHRLRLEESAGDLLAVSVEPDAGDMLHSVETGAAALGSSPGPGLRQASTGGSGTPTAGSGATDTPIPGLLVWPADAPAVARATVAAVARAARQTPLAVVQPVHGGKPGHPIHVPPMVLARDLPSGEDGLRGLIRRAVQTRRCELCEVPVSDPGCLINVNTPEQYQALLSGMVTR
jgi:CTP:molybdopterin cytidylyltransferase MocA